MEKGVKRRSYSKPAHSQSQVQAYRNHDDLFGAMESQMMSRMGNMFGGFGGFGSVFDDLDDFGFGFGGSRKPRDRQVANRDPFSNILSRFDEFGTDFSKLGTGAGKPAGNFVSQTFVYSQKLGPNGQPHVEQYMKSNVGGTNAQGKMIKHSEEMYKNTATGIKKHAQERVLDGRAHKAVKTKLSNGEQEVQNMLHGLEEADTEDFHRQWAEESNKLGLEKILQQMPTKHALEAQLRRPAERPRVMALTGSESTNCSINIDAN